MSEENYVYLKVKLWLKPGQSESSIQEIVQELRGRIPCEDGAVLASFKHEEIVDMEIGEPLAMSVTEEGISYDV